MTTPRDALRRLEAEAAEWLSCRPAPADSTPLFSALLQIPYLTDLHSHQPSFVANSEQTLAVAFSMSRPHGPPPPLQEGADDCGCGCARLDGVAVQKMYLSGSVREGSDVRLFADEVSDIDVMFQLGPIGVRWASAATEQEPRTGGTACYPPDAPLPDQGTGGGEHSPPDASCPDQETSGGPGPRPDASSPDQGNSRGADPPPDAPSPGQEASGGPGPRPDASSPDQGNSRGADPPPDAPSPDQEASRRPGPQSDVTSLDQGNSRGADPPPDAPSPGQEASGGPGLRPDALSPDQGNSRGADPPPDAPSLDQEASRRPGPRSDVTSLDQEIGLVVRLKRTPQPGFVLLRHGRRASCKHPGQLPFSGERVVRLMDRFRAALTRDLPSFSGPAVSATIEDMFNDPKAIDLVACVLCPVWPCEDYATRPRPSGWPGTTLVRRLCRTPIFLVPVGFPGSVTERDEWRMSFSRHEYVVYRSMAPLQRVCLTVLKYCKAIIGEPAAPLKSYYLKTALMWLCENRPPDQWTLENMHQSLLAVLRYLESCLHHRFLPCYFFPEVDLLAGRGLPELQELAAAVAALRARLLSAALALASHWLDTAVAELAPRLLAADSRLSDNQFWMMTAVSAVNKVRRHDHGPLNVLKDLVFSGKLRPYGRLPPAPLCSSLPLGIRAAREFQRALRDQDGDGNHKMSNFIGLVQPLLQVAHLVRRPPEPEDSWLKED